LFFRRTPVASHSMRCGAAAASLWGHLRGHAPDGVPSVVKERGARLAPAGPRHAPRRGGGGRSSSARARGGAACAAPQLPQGGPAAARKAGPFGAMGRRSHPPRGRRQSFIICRRSSGDAWGHGGPPTAGMWLRGSPDAWRARLPGQWGSIRGAGALGRMTNVCSPPGSKKPAPHTTLASAQCFWVRSNKSLQRGRQHCLVLPKILH
jgi:hypothetical protein